MLNSHWHDFFKVAGTIAEQSLVRFFNSHWHDSTRVFDTILQQSLKQLFNSYWHDCSTVAGMIVQQSLAWLVNRHLQDSSAVMIIFLLLCWHDSSIVVFTVEELCHAPEIRHLIPVFVNGLQNQVWPELQMSHKHFLNEHDFDWMIFLFDFLTDEGISTNFWT